jgi:hypothetical protein
MVGGGPLGVICRQSGAATQVAMGGVQGSGGLLRTRGRWTSSQEGLTVSWRQILCAVHSQDRSVTWPYSPTGQGWWHPLKELLTREHCGCAVFAINKQWDAKKKNECGFISSRNKSITSIPYLLLPVLNI